MHRLVQKEQKEPQEKLGTHAHRKKEVGRSETRIEETQILRGQRLLL